MIDLPKGMKPLSDEDLLTTLPDGQVVLYRDKAHTYRRIADGGSTPLKSVTNLVSRVDGGHSDGLVQWAWQLGVEGKPWKDERDKKGAIGTSVHAALEALAQGSPPDLEDFEPDARGYVTAICSWWLDEQPEPIDQEFVVAHPTLNYAGRVDQLLEINGEKWLVDLKTSKTLSAKFHTQMGLYALAMDACGMGRPDRLAILHAMPDGEFVFLESMVRDEHVALIPLCVQGLDQLKRDQKAVDL
jgi:hypothetical protein